MSVVKGPRLKDVELVPNLNLEDCAQFIGSVQTTVCPNLLLLETVLFFSCCILS